LFLIDINSLIFRAFYGIKNNLTTSNNTPVNALFGVIKMLSNIVRDKQPTEMVIAYDSQAKLKRVEEYKEYKANRESPPDELKSQFPLIKEFIKIANFQSFEEAGYEADDIIATMAVKYKDEFDEIYIVSSDKDLMQLVDETTFIYDTMKDKIYDIDGVFDKFGVYPNQIGDYLAMVGDVSDNIPGVKGIGPKGASALLVQFKTLDNIYRNISLIKGKKKDYFIENEKKAYLSRKLVALNYDLPIEISNYKNGGIDLYTNDLLNFYNGYELKSIIGNRKYNQTTTGEDKENKEKLDFSKFKKVEDINELEDILILLENERTSLYFNFNNKDYKNMEIYSFAIASVNNVFYFVYSEENKENLNGFLYKIFNSDSTKIIYNAKLLMHLFNDLKIKYKNIYDISLASYRIDATAHDHTIENIIKHNLNIEPIQFSEVVKNSKTSMPDADQEKLFEYTTEKAFLSQNLKEKFESKLEKENLTEIFNMEVELTDVLASMENLGIKIDTVYLNELKKEFDNRRDQLIDLIYKEVGKPFNINSPKQLGTILFEELELPVIKKTKTGYSTDEEVLTKLAKYSEVPILILEYRGLTKLVSTYLDGLINVADKDEIVRTTFNSTITATGRLSSSNPNLQNIPIRTDNGKLIRKAFISRKNKKFIIVDYSQIELRILAHLSKDQTFIDSFNKNQDVHKRTASEVFNTPIDEVTDFQRSAAKSINFGLIYGMGEHKLSNELGIKHREAKKYIDLYFEKYSKIKEFKEAVLEDVRKNGFIKTYFGRVRYFNDINSRNVNIKNHVERMAFNTLIQGTAADLIKFVMVKIHNYLETLDYDANILLQIHDELIIEVDDNYVEELYPKIKDIMENSYKFDVPLIVDGSFSDHWEK
jgi:DNA polymerase-1